MKEAGLWVMLSVLVFQTLLPVQDELPFEFSAELKQWKEANFEERFKGSYGINAYLEPEMDVDNFNVYEGVLAFLDNREGAISYLINGMTALEEQEVEVSASLNFLLANFHFENKDYTAASEQYIKAIHKHPNFLRAYENLGYGFMFEEENEKALPVLLKAIELGSNDSQIHGLIGFLYLEKELYLSALSAYELAMLFNPRNNAWRFGILQCLINLDRREAALGVAEEILLFDPAAEMLHQANGDIFQVAQPLAQIRVADAPHARHGIFHDLLNCGVRGKTAIDTFQDTAQPAAVLRKAPVGIKHLVVLAGCAQMR